MPLISGIQIKIFLFHINTLITACFTLRGLY